MGANNKSYLLEFNQSNFNFFENTVKYKLYFDNKFICSGGYYSENEKVPIEIRSYNDWNITVQTCNQLLEVNNYIKFADIIKVYYTLINSLANKTNEYTVLVMKDEIIDSKVSNYIGEDKKNLIIYHFINRKIQINELSNNLELETILGQKIVYKKISGKDYFVFYLSLTT